MNIRKRLGMTLMGIGLLGLSAAAWASGTVVVGRPYYGYGGYYPPPYAGYIPSYYPPYPAYPAYGYPGYYSPNPALQMPYRPANPANLYQYMNGRVIPPNPLYYDGGSDYYLY